jgi:hypothetical protein
LSRIFEIRPPSGDREFHHQPASTLRCRNHCAGLQFFILPLEKTPLESGTRRYFSSITFTSAISTLILIAFSFLAHLKNPR